MKAEDQSAEREALPLDEALDDFDRRLSQWAKAYPLSVFPEPDYARVHEVLTAAGMTLDRISASNMRHVVTTLNELFEPVRAALSAREAPAREGWQPIETAPKCFAIPRLLWTPMRNGKLAEALPLCGYWMEPFWVIVNADAAIQRVEPTHWMPLPQAPTTDPAPPAAKAVEMDADEVRAVLTSFLHEFGDKANNNTVRRARALMGGKHG